MIAQRVVGPRTRAPEGGDHLGQPEIVSKAPGVPIPDGLRRMRGPPRGDARLPKDVPGVLEKLRDGRRSFVFGRVVRAAHVVGGIRCVPRVFGLG